MENFLLWVHCSARGFYTHLFTEKQICIIKEDMSFHLTNLISPITVATNIATDALRMSNYINQIFTSVDPIF